MTDLVAAGPGLFFAASVGACGVEFAQDCSVMRTFDKRQTSAFRELLPSVTGTSISLQQETAKG